MSPQPQMPPPRLPSVPPRSGRQVLLVFALGLALLTAGVVLWSILAPRVPAARQRMEGMALPTALRFL